MASVREQMIPAEQPPLVGEVSANFCGWECHVVSATDPLRPYSQFSRLEPLLFDPGSSSNCTHEAEWSPFQTHYFSDLVAPGLELGPLDL
jgi:hypothetical protein